MQSKAIFSNISRMNLILNSLKVQKSLVEAVSSLRSNQPININQWKMDDIKSLCEFYIELGWGKRYKQWADQLEVFLSSIYRFISKRCKVLANMIYKTPVLRKYLTIHSVFPINEKEYDWLIRFMINILYPSDRDIENLIKTKEVPEYIINKLSIFNPEPIKLEFFPHRIKYGMWQKKFAPPINIIDIDFENTGIKNIDMKKELARYDHVSIASDGSFKYSDEIDYELPF